MDIQDFKLMHDHKFIDDYEYLAAFDLQEKFNEWQRLRNRNHLTDAEYFQMEDKGK